MEENYYYSGSFLKKLEIGPDPCGSSGWASPRKAKVTSLTAGQDTKLSCGVGPRLEDRSMFLSLFLPPDSLK